MRAALRNRLMQVAIVLATGGAGTAAHFAGQPSDAVVLAMELGSHFESRAGTSARPTSTSSERASR